MSEYDDDLAMSRAINGPGDPVADTATMKQITRNLFGATDDDEEPDQPEHGKNYVPREGQVPDRPRGDRDVRQFISDLFGGQL